MLTGRIHDDGEIETAGRTGSGLVRWRAEDERAQVPSAAAAAVFLVQRTATREMAGRPVSGTDNACQEIKAGGEPMTDPHLSPVAVLIRPWK